MPKKKSSAHQDDKSNSSESAPLKSDDDSSTYIGVKEGMFYLSLNHEIRRKIIQHLGEKGLAGFTDFKRITGVSIGTIYHHLDTIKDLIYQDPQKKYHLTKLGEQAYRALNQNSDTLHAVEFEESVQENSAVTDSRKKILEFLYLKKIYVLMEKIPQFSIIFPILITIINSILCAVFDVELYLLFAFPVLNSPYNYFWAELFQIVSVVIGYFLLILTSDLFSRLLFGKKSDWKILSKYLSLCYIPITMYLILYGILQNIPEFPQSFMNKILVILFQIWGILILAFILSTKNYLKFERAIIISVFINYGSFLFVLLFKTQFLLLD